MQLSQLRGGDNPLGMLYPREWFGFLWSPEKQRFIPFLLCGVQLLFRFPGAAEGSWTVTQHHHLGTATMAQMRARGELVFPTGLGLLPGVAPGPEPSGRGSHHPSCKGPCCPQGQQLLFMFPVLGTTLWLGFSKV